MEIRQLRKEIQHIRRYTDVLERIMGGDKQFSQEEKNLMLERVIKILTKESANLEQAKRNRENE